MSIKSKVDMKAIDSRISQLERRFSMEWYNKDQLLEDLFKLKETIRMLAKKHEEIKNHLGDYNRKIEKLMDQLI